MYDFYFSNYFAYYICKVNGEEKQAQARAWSIPGLISDNQDYQIPVHEGDFYFSNYFAYYICKGKGEEFQRLSTAGEPSADSITKTIFIF